MKHRTKCFSVIFFVLYLLIISGCQTNDNNDNTVKKEINSKIFTVDELAREIIYSSDAETKGQNYEFTGEVTYLFPKDHQIHMNTNIKFDSILNYFFSVDLTGDENYNKLKKGSIITVKADLTYHKGTKHAVISMKNGSIIEINNDNVIEESEVVNSKIQSSDNDESSKEEQSRLLEESRLKEESKLLEQSKAEQSRLLEESRAEQSRLQEESRLREQSKTQQIYDFTFILNTDSKVYHLHECSAAKRMKSDKKLYVTKTAKTQYEARQQIEAEGYRVCGICTR